MNRLSKYCSLIGFAVIFGLSNTAYAACSFDLNADPAPDRVTDLSGQGNFACTDIIGSNGAAMVEVAVTFDRDGSWVLDSPVMDSNGFVTNSPDDILVFPQGNGSRCDFSYLRSNAVEGSGLGIGGNIDVRDSIACTDNIVNVEEIILPEPDIVITGDGCEVTLKEQVDGSLTDITADFDVITGTNLDGTRQAICSADGTPQNECVRGCPEFIDIDALQANNRCLADPTTNLIPLTDPNTGERCTPCLTAAVAEATIPGFDTGVDEFGLPLKLCWEYVNRVNEDDIGNTEVPPGFYKPHKQVRDQTTQTVLFNECYTTTTTINFFGREITKTVTTCD